MEVIFQLMYLAIIFPIALIVIQNFKESKKLAEAKAVSFQFTKWVPMIILLPIIVLVFAIFKSFQQFARLLLSLKYGEKFGGILADQDAMFALEYPKQVTVNSLFLIECDKPAHEFYDMLRESITKSLKSKLRHNPKIFGSLNMFMGYPYILKDDVNIEDCIKKLPAVEGDKMSKAELFKLNEEGYVEMLPKDNKGFWDIRIGTQHVNWYDNGEKKLYPVQFRFSHCLTDGVHIFKGILSLFGDVKEVEAPEKVQESKTNESDVMSFLLPLQSLAHQIWCLISWISIITVNSLVVMEEPYNVLFGKKLSGKKFMCLAQEETPRLIEVAKRIKKKYSGVVLMDVFATAYTASVTEYCQKYTTEIPTYFTCGVTESPRATNLLNLTPTKLHHTEVVCTNNIGIYVPKLQTFVKTKTDEIPLVKILQTLATQNRQIHRSNEPEAHRWLFNTYSPIIPQFLSAPFMGKYGVQALLTNVPGPPKITIMNGHLLDNMIFWCPHTHLTGIGLAIMTYGGCLQMSLNVDSVLVPEREQVQKILDGVFKYIDLLDEATSKALKSEN